MNSPLPLKVIQDEDARVTFGHHGRQWTKSGCCSRQKWRPGNFLSNCLNSRVWRRRVNWPLRNSTSTAPMTTRRQTVDSDTPVLGLEWKKTTVRASMSKLGFLSNNYKECNCTVNDVMRHADGLLVYDLLFGCCCHAWQAQRDDVVCRSKC